MPQSTPRRSALTRPLLPFAILSLTVTGSALSGCSADPVPGPDPTLAAFPTASAPNPVPTTIVRERERATTVVVPPPTDGSSATTGTQGNDRSRTPTSPGTGQQPAQPNAGTRSGGAAGGGRAAASGDSPAQQPPRGTSRGTQRDEPTGRAPGADAPAPGDDSTQAPAPAPSSGSTTPTPSAPPSNGTQLLTWPGGNEVVRASTTGPVAQGSSPDFQTFVRSEVKRLNSQTSRTHRCRADDSISIERYRTDGWAGGSVSEECSGRAGQGEAYAAYWSNEGGRWRLVATADGPMACSEVTRLRIPRDVLETCANGNASVPNPVP